MAANNVNWVEFYRQIFINHLNNSATFVAHLEFMSFDEKRYFTDQSRTREFAVKEWLDYLKTKQHDHGVYEQVLKALRDSGQKHISEKLEDGKAVPCEIVQQRKDLVHIFFPKLVTETRINDVIPYLKCLSAEERNEIMACKDQHGNEQAAMKMVFYLVLKGEEMYGQLINALVKAGQHDLATDLQEMIEPDYGPTSDKDFPGSSLGPDDEGSFNIGYTSLSCNDNLDYYDDGEEEDDQVSEFLESFYKLQISENLEHVESQCSNKATRPSTPQLVTSTDVNKGGAKPKIGRPDPGRMMKTKSTTTSRKPREIPKQSRSLSDNFEIDAKVGPYTDRKNTSISFNIPKIRHHPEQLQNPSEFKKSRDTCSPIQLVQKDDSAGKETRKKQAPKNKASQKPTTRRQDSRNSPQELAKKMSTKCKVSISTAGKTPKPKPDQRVKNFEITPPKQHTKASLKSSTNKSIVGKVVSAKAWWASNCCKKCFKIVENKDKLVCKKCKTRLFNVSDVVKRLVAEVTLRTDDRKMITKICHCPELQKFFKENGDALSNHQLVDELSTYLKSLKFLELWLDGKGDVSKISKH
ncbi:uncharacterized protein [Amphiura filiformis]|uniref:uncharacterized protein n=1 Tax=Amphiura filiformis TaxID=82378 RepID=UPI003B219DA5